MDYGSLYAFLTAVGFKTNNLTIRWLQEKGASTADTFAIYKYALIPAVLWGLIFVRRSDLTLIFHSTELLAILATIVVLWNLQAYLMALVINSTSSMLLFSTIFNVLLLPMFLIFGVLFNHDRPNIFTLVSIAVLLVALLIRPAPHKQNLRPQLSRPLAVILILVFLKAACDTVLQGFGREALKQIDPEVFLAVFSVPTLAVCWVLSNFYKAKPGKGSEIMQQRQWLAITLVPLTWFMASIPETFSLAAIPIYTFISINVITFVMDTVSDVLHKRIHLSFQTVSFIGLVILGISLSVLSV
jgi:hypothetical protein